MTGVQMRVVVRRNSMYQHPYHPTFKVPNVPSTLKNRGGRDGTTKAGRANGQFTFWYIRERVLKELEAIVGCCKNMPKASNSL